MEMEGMGSRTDPYAKNTVFSKMFGNRGNNDMKNETADTGKTSGSYYGLDHLVNGPDTDMIHENLRRVIGERIDENSYLPRPRDNFLRFDSGARSVEHSPLKTPPPKIPEEKLLPEKRHAPKLSLRQRDLRKRNVLLNRLVGPIEEENNNTVKDVDKAWIFNECKIIDKEQPAPTKFAPFGGKPSKKGNDGLAIVDLYAVAEKLENEYFRAPPPSSSAPKTNESASSTRSSSSVSNSRGYIPKKRAIDEGRGCIDLEYISRDSPKPPPPIFKPLTNVYDNTPKFNKDLDFPPLPGC